MRRPHIGGVEADIPLSFDFHRVQVFEYVLGERRNERLGKIVPHMTDGFEFRIRNRIGDQLSRREGHEGIHFSVNHQGRHIELLQ